MPSLTLRPFRAVDYPVYAAWFADPDLDRFLGPIGEDWLAAVLTETDATTLCLVDHDDRPVALVGVYHADASAGHGRHHLSDFAVDPARRRSGLGVLMLDLLADWPLPGDGIGFSALVDQDNHAMRGLLTRVGGRGRGPAPAAPRLDEWRSPATRHESDARSRSDDPLPDGLRYAEPDMSDADETRGFSR